MTNDDSFKRALAYCHNDTEKMLALYKQKCRRLRAENLRLSATISNLNERSRLEYSNNYPFLTFRMDEKTGRLIYIRICHCLNDIESVADSLSNEILIYVPLSEFRTFQGSEVYSLDPNNLK